MKKIYLDMDGVLVNFWGRVYDLLEIEMPEEHKSLNQLGFETSKEFWDKLKPFEEAEEFWPKIPEYEWTQDLISKVKSSGVEWYILTSPNLSEYSAKGKVNKLQQMFGPHFKNYVITKHKHLLASPDCLLIDDTEEKCDKFQEHGGQVILFPQNWNRHRIMIDRRVEYYTNRIKEFINV